MVKMTTFTAKLFFPLFALIFFIPSLWASPVQNKSLSEKFSLESNGTTLKLLQKVEALNLSLHQLSLDGFSKVEIHQPSPTSKFILNANGSSINTIDAFWSNGQLEIRSPDSLTLGEKINITAPSLFISAENINMGGELISEGGTIAIHSMDSLIIKGNIDVSEDKAGLIELEGRVVYVLGSLDANGKSQAGKILIKAENILQAGNISADSENGPAGEIDLEFDHRYIDQENSSVTASSNSGESGGSIRLLGGPRARLFSSGQHKVTGNSEPGHGGEIQFLGQDLFLEGARLDASGFAGGGIIRVGGDYQGSGSLPQARSTRISAASVLMADAREYGSGGDVVIWSKNQTQFFGQVSAESPNKNGFVEISSKDKLNSVGAVSSGTLLLDPKDVNVDDSATTFPQITITDPNPNGSNFGEYIVPLTNGNYVITDSGDNLNGTKSGAAYLFNGKSGALIATLTGSAMDHEVGSSGITALTNGNYVVESPLWDNGGTADVGAVTWGNGSTGISGVVSTDNSLHGTTAGDEVSSESPTALPNGNYVVTSPEWDNGGTANAGAVTWANGDKGLTGPVTTANSLYGTTASDSVGDSGIVVLSNGNYVVPISKWDNGAMMDAGAATWGDASMAIMGAVDSSNSLVGTSADDKVGSGITALTNGNYVLRTPNWDDGGTANVGAVTWGDGSSGTKGLVSKFNSLYGSTMEDRIGDAGVIALTNGNYVVASNDWDNGGTVDAGAVTWGDGSMGTVGEVTTANSLYGTTADDNVGLNHLALTNGNYVIMSRLWDNGGTANVGAVTWGNGSMGTVGEVTTSNSLHGVTAGDSVSFSAGTTVAALTNGNYVVGSGLWDNNGTADIGAVTWCDGSTGTTTGPVTTSNSLYGTTASDRISSGDITALNNGNYVVASHQWDNSGTVDAGAVTWGNGTMGITGPVSVSNSLYGTTASDQVGETGITALANGNYVVISKLWDNGGTADVGAATWGNGTTGITGPVSTSNSLHGSTASDEVGGTNVQELDNGSYVVVSRNWDNGGNADAGAVTLADGNKGITGPVTNLNSVIGQAASTVVTNNVDNDPTNNTFAVGFLDEGTGTVRLACDTLDSLSFGCLANDSATITSQFLTDVLNTGTAVSLQANNDLTVTSAITANNPGGDGGALTLQAGRSVFINNNITTDNGALTIIGNDLLANGVEDGARDAGNAVITMNGGTNLDSGTGPITIELRTGSDKTNTGCGDVSLESVSGGVLTVDVQCNTSTLMINNAINASSVTLDADNDISFSANGDITSTGTLMVRADSDSNSDAGSGGALTMVDGSVLDAGASSITLSADENITLAKVMTTGSSNSAVTLTSVSDSIVDAGTTAENVTATNGGIVVTTGMDLGESSNFIEGTVNTLDLSGVAGSDFFNNAGTTVGFDSTFSNGEESTTNVNLGVSLNQINGTTTVAYAVTGGTASGSGTDFTLANGTLTFTPGDNTENIALSVVDDFIEEGDETIIVTLLNPSNANLGSNTTHIYTINANDTQPTVAFDSSSIAVAESAGTVNIPVSLTNNFGLAITIDYTVSGGTATGGGVDYTLASGTLTFNPGDTTQNISVSIVGDSFVELDETVTLTLSNPVNTSLGGISTHTLSIQDDDTVPTLGFDTTSSEAFESSTNPSIGLSLSNIFSSDITVDYGVTGGTATGEGTDYTLANGNLTFTAGTLIQTISPTVIDDTLQENNETIIITLSNPVGGVLGNNSSHTYFINDDDFSLPEAKRESQVVSPYWQIDSATYTFIGVSHPSLEQMNSNIGVRALAMTNEGLPLVQPLEFTIESSQTQRIFIIQSNHPFLSPTTVPDGLFLVGNPDSIKHGQLQFTPLATNPENMFDNGYPDITMLHYWGAVVVQATSTGFAMEFVGDNQDSRALHTPYFSGVN